MTEKTKYPEIRELTRGDRVRMSFLIKQLVEASGDAKLAELVPAVAKPSEGKEDTPVDTDQIYALIKSVLDGLVKWCEEDLTVWLMDLTGTATIEEFNEMPFDLDVYIIDQLLSRESFINFFTKASGLYKKIRGLAG